MPKFKIVLALMVAGALLLLWWMPQSKIQQQPSPGQPQQYEAKTDEQPPVLIRAQPEKISFGEGETKFSIALTTHAGDLSYDLTKQVSLVDSFGGEYSAIRWEGPKMEGHHIQGELVFGALRSGVKNLTLVIKDIGGIPQRTLSWDIK